MMTFKKIRGWVFFSISYRAWHKFIYWWSLPETYVRYWLFHFISSGRSFSRILALSLTVAYLHYNCQAQKSRIANMKARKTLMGEKEIKWERDWAEIMVSSARYSSGCGEWDFAWPAFESQLGKSLSYYYYCCKISLVFRLIFAYSLSNIIYLWLKKKNII